MRGVKGTAWCNAPDIDVDSRVLEQYNRFHDYISQNCVIRPATTFVHYTCYVKLHNTVGSHQRLWLFAKEKKKGHPLVLTDEAVLAGDSRVVDEHVYTAQARFDPTERLQNIILVTQVTKLGM